MTRLVCACVCPVAYCAASSRLVTDKSQICAVLWLCCSASKKGFQVGDVAYIYMKKGRKGKERKTVYILGKYLRSKMYRVRQIDNQRIHDNINEASLIACSIAPLTRAPSDLGAAHTFKDDPMNTEPDGDSKKKGGGGVINSMYSTVVGGINYITGGSYTCGLAQKIASLEHFPDGRSFTTRHMRELFAVWEQSADPAKLAEDIVQICEEVVKRVHDMMVRRRFLCQVYS